MVISHCFLADREFRPLAIKIQCVALRIEIGTLKNVVHNKTGSQYAVSRPYSNK